MSFPKQSLLLFLFFFIPFQAVAAPHKQLFVSVIQEPPVLDNRGRIEALVEFARKAGVDTLFVQVYRANKSWFPSQHADQSPYEECLRKVGEDAFGLLIDRAHAEGIKVHAWVNLLSLSSNKSALLLKKYGPGILTRDLQPKKKMEDYKIDSQYFLEPGDPIVRGELGDVVEDVLAAYPALDGIQFDYIRYPDRRPYYGYTERNMDRYKKATGRETIEEDRQWKDWKRRQVTELLDLLVKRARVVRPGIQVSVTGCMPLVRAYDEAFQDWTQWVESGMVDFVTVMSYTVDRAEFQAYIREAKSRISDPAKITMAVGAYELLDKQRTFADELEQCAAEGCGGCAILHYGSLRERPALGYILRRAYRR